MIDKPEISVIMPVWNGDRYLHEAVESILNQTFKEFEFLIIDDGSTDSTSRIIEEYAKVDSRIRIISLDHQGIVTALNHGVSEARAEWITRMDCDDIAHPNRLSRQWQSVNSNPRCVLCHTGTRYIGDTSLIIKRPRVIRSTALMKLLLCQYCPVAHPTVMFRKSAFLKCGGYAAEERHAEDYGLWGRMIDLGDFIGLTETLLDYRVHSQSISKQQIVIQKSLGQKIRNRHCSRFFCLSDSDAERASQAICYPKSQAGLRDWFWLVYMLVPRLRPQSLELWLWISWRSLIHLISLMKRSIASYTII